MSDILEKAGVCPHCGAALKQLAPSPAPAAPHDGLLRYDLEALAAQAAQERAYDESARMRVTQEDIRKLLDKRRKGRK